MGQTSLLPHCNAQDRWHPVVPPFRLRPLAKISSWKPLPGQLFLSGMDPTDPAGEVSPAMDDRRLALCEEEVGDAARWQPICPNCGGTKFDEEGDCTLCWEPAFW
jgi:hypothetical protein